MNITIYNTRPEVLIDPGTGAVVLRGSGPQGPPGAVVDLDGETIAGYSAASGEYFVDIVAANDPTAHVMTIYKNDTTENPVTVRPASGTITTAEGRAAVCSITVPDGSIRIAPNAADNNWHRIG